MPKLENIGYWLGGAVTLWFVLVLVQGIASQHDAIWLPVDFETSAQFGDSFGSLSALMASVAAIGAWKAVSLQSTANSGLKAREKELRIEAKNRDFENSYFQLFDLFQRLVESMDVDVQRDETLPSIGQQTVSRIKRQIEITTSRSVATGKDVFVEMVSELDRQIDANESPKEAYEQTFTTFESDLAHYLRVLFNLIKRIEEHFDHLKRDEDYSDAFELDQKAYEYVRLLRAQISEAELIIIAMNGLYHPAGSDHFEPLIYKFALLNNLSDSAQIQYGLKQLYKEAAFKSDKAREAKG